MRLIEAPVLPFVGTGTVPLAVATVGEGRRFAGSEIDGELVRVARRRVWRVLGSAGRTAIAAVGT
jgi:hypothetical protein